MSRPLQSVLVLADDAANLQEIAELVRSVPGVTDARVGTFHRERVGDETHIEMFVPRPPDPAD